MAAGGDDDATTHLVLLPDLATGHLMSMIQAGIRISRHAHSNKVMITVLLVHPPSATSAGKVAAMVQRVVAASDEDDNGIIRFHRLPAIIGDNEKEAVPPADARQLPAFKSRYMQLYAPHIKAALATLRPAPAAILLDFFATPVLDVLDGVPASYVYFTSTAAFLSLMMRLPGLDEEGHQLGLMDIPGMATSPVPEVLARTRENAPNYDWFVYHGRRFREADGIIVNTVTELEQGIIDAIAATPPPLYPIGPVIDLNLSASTTENNQNRCVAWLDAQPPGSVVYLCFGSVGWLPPEQAQELAKGLERSGHRFLWVMRGPPSPGSHHLTEGEDVVKKLLLPDPEENGFVERGMVWPAWAPQREILAHPAVGAFVTHAGWNSCLEGLWHGLPMVPWPLYAEQHLNAFQAVTDMGVAVQLDGAPPPRNLVDAAAVETAVRSVMGETQQGKMVREKALIMKQHCRNAVAPGGSSHAALQLLWDDIRRRAAGTAVVD